MNMRGMRIYAGMSIANVPVRYMSCYFVHSSCVLQRETPVFVVRPQAATYL